MKRTNIHISAAIALLLGLAACTQDEAGFLPEGAEGTSIVFTATGLNPAATATAGTRAPVDGNWEGVQSVALYQYHIVQISTFIFPPLLLCDSLNNSVKIISRIVLDFYLSFSIILLIDFDFRTKFIFQFFFILLINNL